MQWKSKLDKKKTKEIKIGDKVYTGYYGDKMDWLERLVEKIGTNTWMTENIYFINCKKEVDYDGT